MLGPSVQFSCSVVSDSLQPHGLQHDRLPCLSPTPVACSNLCPSSWWCHPTISFISVVPFSSCLQSFPASGSFPMSLFSASGEQSIGASASVLPMNIQDWKVGGKMETVKDCIFLGSKITADGDCSHEITRHLLLGRKAITNLDSILKSRDITLPTKVCIIKAMVFLVVMYGCESWTIKKVERWYFWTVVLEKTLESSLDFREIQPVHPKEISPEYSLEGLML